MVVTVVVTFTSCIHDLEYSNKQLVTISLYHPNSFIILGLEGKAGMATIVDEHKNLDLLSLTKALQKSLPPYARPVFIRLASEVDTTGNCSLIIQITVELNRCIHKAGD